MHDAILLLGSNINPRENLQKALALLNQLCTITAKSRIFETKAVGSDGPDFLNQAVMINTDGGAAEFKRDIIDPIEIALKRVRVDNKYAPRTIDIDLIIFDAEILDENLWKYKFIALPVSDILPDLMHPDTNRTLREIITDLE